MKGGRRGSRRFGSGPGRLEGYGGGRWTLEVGVYSRWCDEVKFLFGVLEMLELCLEGRKIVQFDPISPLCWIWSGLLDESSRIEDA
jgi:hypothetical protein